MHTYPKQNQFYRQFQFYKNWTLSISHAGWIRRRAPDISTLMCLETEFWPGLVNRSIIAAMNSYAKLSDVSVKMISTTQIKRGGICVHLMGPCNQVLCKAAANDELLHKRMHWFLPLGSYSSGEVIFGLATIFWDNIPLRMNKLDILIYREVHN